MSDVIHACPPDNSPVFPCCGAWILEHLDWRMTLNENLVSCTGTTR